MKRLIDGIAGHQYCSQNQHMAREKRPQDVQEIKK
jgi:hypothetical protein